MTKHPFLFPVVAAALFDREGRLLVQQRPLDKQHGGLWEFPGGKIEHDETPEAALARELAEELGIAVDPAALLPLDFATRPHGDRLLLLLLYQCHGWQGAPRAIEAAAIAWRRPGELASLAMPPVDRILVERLIRRGAA